MINTENIPAILKEIGLFCLTKNKQPICPSGGNAKPNDPKSFGTLESCIGVLEKHPNKGYGLGLGLFGDLVGIDIDHCVGDDGELSEMAKTIVELMDSYTEFSPSGSGVHILCSAPGFTYDKSRYYTKNSTIGLEVYVAGCTNRYLTVTGKTIHGADISKRNEELQTLFDSYMLRGKTAADNPKESFQFSKSSVEKEGMP